MDNLIFWSLSPYNVINENLIWNKAKILNNNSCLIRTERRDGFNFIYIKIKNNLKFKIYNELNFIMFDSQLNEFHFFENYELNNNYLIIRKKDVYNTHNSVTFKIIFNND